MTYTTKASAIRAAKTACKNIMGNAYEATEGWDFEVWSSTPWGEVRAVWNVKIKIVAE